MATSTKKLSQQELRQLMREKVQNKTDIRRIDSPLARYDDRGQLWCRICNQIINNEFLWSTHLIGKLHKKKVEELKQKSKSSSTKESSSSSGPLKRSLPVENIESISSNKIKKSSHVNIEDSIENKPTESVTAVISDTSLPGDFFDDGTKPVEKESTNELPKGFFDDPKVERKVRKTNNDQTLETQFELFRKEIAEESIVSQNLLEEELEDLEKEKTLTEIDEQIENWAKVDEIQRKIENIHKKHENIEMNGENSDNQDDDDDDDPIDFNDMNFWRNKVVFR
ncbi:hypothetical protein BLA29_001664 [Euroglyphus maynei]|uniref:Zinc finger protein 830 n=1 Tax=Euroglyphus maynei TaxID=6958 RepID=A0A1Y3AT31_EURMA|nr:hypothetical protein BLA29_001664 [Euroglyphus maynei]